MNVALISKWKWRILTEKEAVWRYGKVKVKVLIGDISVVGKKDSIWWRDLLISDNYENLNSNHFAGAIECTVWSGKDIPFWYACWTGSQTLMEAYPELYCFAGNHLAEVFCASIMLNGSWSWRLENMVEAGSRGESGSTGSSGEPEFTHQLSELILELLFELQQRQIAVRDSSDDAFSWRLEINGVFSVSSCYDRFKEKHFGPPLDNSTVLALSHLWKIKAPLKIFFFGRSFIINKLATRDLLVKKGILTDGNDSKCAFCLSEEESLRHLFVNCEVTKGIWRKVYGWVGVDTSLSREEFVNYFHNCLKIKCVKTRVIGAVMWLSTVWNIWLMRNSVIFESEKFSFLDCLSEIVFNAWR
ncbi:uncharacterized protein LOC131613265 [Vicia villosa]|uniref:uncharacterized protein LOC131613265 n=1 Tax=Vicia villosa TaxID=3911 RepID=UPI00273B5E16|nr:uncharacterized protein LOC131613265 [Vicia villosa]